MTNIATYNLSSLIHTCGSFQHAGNIFAEENKLASYVCHCRVLFPVS